MVAHNAWGKTGKELPRKGVNSYNNLANNGEALTGSADGNTVGSRCILGDVIDPVETDPKGEIGYLISYNTPALIDLLKELSMVVRPKEKLVR